MLRITADLFSGRPNPSWLVPEGEQARDALRALSRDTALLAAEAPAIGHLGFRGLVVEVTGDQVATDFGPSTYLAVGRHAVDARAGEVAERRERDDGRGRRRRAAAGVDLPDGHVLHRDRQVQPRLLEQQLDHPLEEQLLQLRHQPADRHLRPTRQGRGQEGLLHE
jgi:hypothetical protein